MAAKVTDLRSALKMLEDMPGQLIETDVEVEPMAELSGVYRYVGAGGTVMRPTKEGPAMIFNNVKGHPGARVAIGVLASRTRVGALLECDPKDLGKKLYHSVDNPIPPVLTEEAAPCQEVVHKATDPDFDLYKLVPAPTNTPVDAGPYITLGMCYASHPDTGVSDVTDSASRGKMNYRSSLHRVHATSEQWQKEQKSLDSVCQSRSVSE